MNNILNVAIATDTILYAPFYLALYGGDFEDTPFGKLKINIIGQEDDLFFNSDGLPSKAVDGFVTLALFFGYADVGICDPSFLLQLYTSSSDNFEKNVKDTLNSFINSLKDEEKESFYLRNSNGNNPLFKKKEEKWEIKYENIQEKFKEKYSIKIIGSLIQKIAFEVVGSYDTDVSHDTLLNSPFFDNKCDKVTHNKIKRLYCSPHPSTGYYIGNSIYQHNWGENKSCNLEKIKYGEELSKIIEDRDALTLSCDFIAIDYLKKQKKIRTFDDYVKYENNVLFTGIIGNLDNTEKINGIKSFLYGIEKNLYHINKILNKKYDNDLSIFIKNKLINSQNSKFYSDKKRLVSFLVSDKKVEDEILSGTEDQVNENINKFISSYVKRLYAWKIKKNDKNNIFISLYYKSIKDGKNDVNVLYKIRTKRNISDSLNKFFNFSLLDSWIKQDKIITKRHKGIIWKLATNENLLLFFAALFVAIESIALYIKIFHVEFDKFLSEYHTKQNKMAEMVGHSFNSNPHLTTNDFHIFIVIILGFLILLLYLTSHKYIKLSKYKKYAFDLNREIPSNIHLLFDTLKRSKK